MNELVGPADPDEPDEPGEEGTAFGRLSRYRQIFVEGKARGLDGTEAVRAAGYTGRRADLAAYRLMVLPQVKAAIAERVQAATNRAGAHEVRIIQELCALAFLDIRKIVDENGALLPLNELPDEVAAALGGVDVEISADGKSSVRKYRHTQKLEALKTLLQYRKLLIERHEHGGPDGGPIALTDPTGLDTARRVAFILQQALREQAGSPGSDSPPATAPSRR